ncbi:MAG: hypothetical protein ACH350_01685 [Parachlamydiaceae bacterium]
MNFLKHYLFSAACMYTGMFCLFTSGMLMAECSFSSANTTTFETGIDNYFSVTVDGNYQQIGQKGTLPKGISYVFNERDGHGYLSGIPSENISAQYPITFQAYPNRNITPASQPCSTQQFTLVVEASPCYFETLNHATFKSGVQSNFPIKVHNQMPGTISITKGTLPPGVDFQDNGNGTAALVGKTTAIGCYELQFKYIQEGGGCSSRQDFLLLVYSSNNPLYCSGQPPIVLSSKKKTSKNGDQKIYKITIEFKAPEQGPSPVAFRIYRDKTLHHLVGEVQNNGQRRFRFTQSGLKKRPMNHYYLVSVGKYGNQSEAVKVKLTQQSFIKCQ